LAERLITPKNKKENIQTLTDVKRGDIISFIVSSENDTNSDSFDWQPTISRADNSELLTNAKTDFCGSDRWPLGRQKSQSPLSQLAQVLLMSNEFMFVD